MRRLAILGAFLAILYSFLVVGACVFQEKLIFLPSKMPMDHDYSQNFCGSFEEFFLTSDDGASLNAVHTLIDDPEGLVLYFHGNAGNVSNLGHIAQLFAQRGYNGIFVDYRSYGKSTGELSEEQLNKDAQLFYDYALERYPEDSITVYGRSFGTGIAARLAAHNSPRALVLESPFYSAVELGQHRFPFLPVSWLLDFRFPSHTYMQEVTCPVYIFHGTEDRMIPYDMAQRLYEAIPGHQKELFDIQGAGHNYLQDFDAFRKGLQMALP